MFMSRISFMKRTSKPVPRGRWGAAKHNAWINNSGEIGGKTGASGRWLKGWRGEVVPLTGRNNATPRRSGADGQTVFRNFRVWSRRHRAGLAHNQRAHYSFIHSFVHSFIRPPVHSCTSEMYNCPDGEVPVHASLSHIRAKTKTALDSARAGPSSFARKRMWRVFWKTPEYERIPNMRSRNLRSVITYAGSY